MPQSPTAGDPSPVADLRLLLSDLEGALNRTAAHLLQLAPTSPFRDDIDSNNNNNNSYPGNMMCSTCTFNDIVEPIEELQQYVEACEASVNNHLTQVRNQVELAVNVSKMYQKMFPNFQNKLLAAAATHDFGSLPAAGNQAPVGGSICNDNVRNYLSRFVRWDPLEFDRVTNAVAAVAEEAILQGVTDADANVRSPQFTSVARPLFPEVSPTVPAGTFASYSTAASGQQQSRRSLNSVMDRLVLRQLQYDGVRLTTSMEMELGCYDRMTTMFMPDSESTSENVPFHVTIPQEIRRGLMHPSLEYADSDTNIQQMMHNTYPHTLQWISSIMELCSRCGSDAFPSSWNVNNALGSSLLSGSGTSFPWNSYDQQSEGEVPAEPWFLTEVDTQATNEHPQQEEEDTRVGPVSLDIQLHFSGLSRFPPVLSSLPMSVVAPWSIVRAEVVAGYSGEETEGGMVDYLQEQPDEEEGLDEILQPESPSMYAEDEEYAEDYTENVEEGEEDVEAEEDDSDNDDNVEEEEEGGEAEEVCVEKLPQEKEVSSNQDSATQLVLLVAQRVYVLLSDIVIIWALQRVSRMITQAKEQERDELQVSDPPPPGLNGDGKGLNGGVSPLSATLQKSVDFILALRRHPLVLWRLEMERGFENTRRCIKKKTTTTATTTSTAKTTTTTARRSTTTTGNKDSKENGERVLDDTTSSPLLLTFSHVLVALGYAPLLWGKQEKEEGENKKRRVQEQLLYCIAPFLSLWSRAQENGNMDNLISADILTDIENEEGDHGISPALPAYTSPFVWQECVLADLLDQVHRLRQLESLLLSAITTESVDTTETTSTAIGATATATAIATDDAAAITRARTTAATTTSPENLLVRLVYPLSNFMLRHLDDYFEKSIIGRLIDEHVNVPFRLPPVSPPTGGNLPPPSPNLIQQQHSSSTQSRDDGISRYRMDIFRTFSLAFGRSDNQGFTIRYPRRGRGNITNNNNDNGNDNNDNSNNNNNSNSNGNNNSNGRDNNNSGNSNGCPSRHPSQNTTNNQRIHAITLELPHASTVLSEQDEERRHATPSLLCPLEQSHYYAANPALGAGLTLVWQPLFQKTMCYCPVTRRRCIDVALCGIQNDVSSSLELFLSQPENRKFGFNPPHLLSCGHVISHNAMLTLSERPHRHPRSGSSNISCPYCSTDTPRSRMILLRCIY